MVGKNWRDFFDVVIVQADKPHFFTDCIKWVTPCSLSVWRMCAGILLMRWGAVISVLLFNNLQNCCSYRPFRRLDGNGDLRWEKIKSLDKGQIYKQVCNEKNVHWPLWHLIYLTAVVFTHWKVCMFLLFVFWVSNECMWLILLFQGNLFDFLRLTGWRGSKVLYFGDHLYSDLAVSIRARWSHHDELPSQCSAWWLTFCGIGISRNFPVWLHLTSLVCDLAKWDFFFFFFFSFDGSHHLKDTQVQSMCRDAHGARCHLSPRIARLWKSWEHLGGVRADCAVKIWNTRWQYERHNFSSEIEDCFVLLCKVKAHCINILTANMSVIMYLINKRVKHGNICWIFQTEDSQSD